MRDQDLKIECIKGHKHAGGTHRNCTNSCVRITHIPTGLQVTVDERSQKSNKKKAIKLLRQKLQDLKQERLAFHKKTERDKKIKEKKYIRTYNYKSKTVKDHRNGKIAPLEEVLLKGRIDLLWEY